MRLNPVPSLWSGRAESPGCLRPTAAAPDSTTPPASEEVSVGRQSMRTKARKMEVAERQTPAWYQLVVRLARWHFPASGESLQPGITQRLREHIKQSGWYFKT